MKNKKIYIAGHSGMVGSAILRNFKENGYSNIIYKDIDELDLTINSDVEKYFSIEKPEIVIIAAAKVGGILANNNFRADFLYINLMIEANLINSAFKYGAEKLLFLGSSCIYPKFAEQPIKEESLLSGYLEYTNEPYAIAKIAGIKLCESYYKQHKSNFFSIMPCNLYGPFDNYDLSSSHVLPALIRKFHEAKILNQKNKSNPPVTIWGSGNPEREFMYVEDLADAVRFMIEKIDAADLYEKGITHLNAGSGKDVTIRKLAEIISEIVGYKGEFIFDTSKPDGTPKKLMDVSRINSLGWKSNTDLHTGIKKAYNWYLSKINGGL